MNSKRGVCNVRSLKRAKPRHDMPRVPPPLSSPANDEGSITPANPWAPVSTDGDYVERQATDEQHAGVCKNSPSVAVGETPNTSISSSTTACWPVKQTWATTVTCSLSPEILRPPLLLISKNFTGNDAFTFDGGIARSGCLAIFSMANASQSSINGDDTQNMRRSVLSQCTEATWRDIVKAWKANSVDSSDEIAAAVRFFFGSLTASMSSSPGLQQLGGDDIVWWQHGSRPCSLRNFTKLKRLLAPLTILIRPERLDADRDRAPVQTIAWSHSLADILVAQPCVRDEVVDMLIGCAGLLQQWNPSTSKSVDLLTRHMYLCQALCCTLHRASATAISPDGNIALLSSLNGKFVRNLSQTEHSVIRRLCPPSMATNLAEARKERQSLVARHQSHQNTPGRRVEEITLVTEEEDGMSKYAFLVRRRREAAANESLPSPFVLGTSWPRLQRCCQPNSTVVKELRRLFFQADGSLAPIVVKDALRGGKHNYINFRNAAMAGQNDKRWQIPIKEHDAKSFVSMRMEVESVLSQAGLIHPAFDELVDIIVLIGGTADQSVHHDMARELFAWLPSVNDDVATSLSGCETSRLRYTDAVFGPNPPRASIISLSTNGRMQLGVQRNLIERSSVDRNQCRILYGRQNEEFTIVREGSHVAVLEVRGGVTFTGDFQHAGVRNFACGSKEDVVMNRLFANIDAIHADDDVAWEDVSDAVARMMCTFPGLDSVCRFYFSTRQSQSNLFIPANSIGLTGCFPNPPSGLEA